MGRGFTLIYESNLLRIIGKNEYWKQADIFFWEGEQKNISIPNPQSQMILS